jgi:hypothetical protein
MRSSKPEIQWRRLEPSFRVAAEPKRAPISANRWLAVILGIAVVLAVAGGGAYWAAYRMAAPSPVKIPPAPVQAAKSADEPRLVGPTAPREATLAVAPEPASAARPPPNLVEGGAPLLAPLPRWEQEAVITPPSPSLEEMPEGASNCGPLGGAYPKLRDGGS